MGPEPHSPSRRVMEGPDSQEYINCAVDPGTSCERVKDQFPWYRKITRESETLQVLR